MGDRSRSTAGAEQRVKAFPVEQDKLTAKMRPFKASPFTVSSLVQAERRRKARLVQADRRRKASGELVADEWRSSQSGRLVTTRANQRAAAKVYIKASSKAGRTVPKYVKELAAEDD